jgi:hypothetical protein
VKIFGFVVFKGGIRENRIYVAIALLTIIVIILAVIFSSSQLTKAYIEDDILGESWSEDIDERVEGSQLFGIEKWVSFTYRNENDSYPAYVTITSIKLFFMMNENDLKDETIETINKASAQGIEIDINSEVTGQRVTRDNAHKTNYFFYDGNDTSKETPEKIKLIGECWNCEKSGISVICIGVAWTTNNANDKSNSITTYWAEIISDKIGTFGLGEYKSNNGLIFNIKCH